MTEPLDELIRQAQPDVSERRLARIYASALLNAAQKQGSQDEILTELQSLIADVSERDPAIFAFFTSGVVGKSSRESALKDAFENRCDPILLQFLLVLNDHERLILLRPIANEYQALHETRARKFPVSIRSAVPLADDQRQRLFDSLRQAFHFDPVFEIQIDPSLLGGVVIRVADWVYDGSVRTQLLTMRKQLLENASHEIQSGRDRLCPAT